MSTFWIVIASVIGFLLLIASICTFGRVSIRITFRKRLRVVLYVLGIPYTLVSDKDPKEKRRDLSRCYNPNAALKRQKRNSERALRKALKKRLKKKQKAAERARKKQLQAKLQASPNLKENLEMILELLKKLYKLSYNKLMVRIHRLQIAVGTSDAAKTAIVYGGVMQSVSVLLYWIKQHLPQFKYKKKRVSVRPNYLSDKTCVHVDISCALYLSQALHIALKMRSAYLKEKRIALKKAKQRIALRAKKEAEKQKNKKS